MKIKAIEKTTGIGIATADSFNEVVEQALSRRASPGSLLFVAGDADILTYLYAREWIGRYKWLTQFFMDLGSQEYLVEAAKSRLELWKTIAESRLIEHECATAPHLSATIGSSLADDVEQLIRMDKVSDCKVYGPDVKKSWAEARTKAIALSRRHESRNYVLAVHEELGAIVVAPDYRIANNSGFKIKDFYRAGRSL